MRNATCLALVSALAVWCLAAPSQAVVVWNLPRVLVLNLTALEHACLYGDLAAAVQALKTENVNRRHRLGWTPLHYACFGGSRDAVRLLLKHGADVNATDDSGCTPLLLAATHDDVALTQTLVDAGANLNAREDLAIGTQGEQTIYKKAVTPVAIAVRRGGPDVASYLLNKTNAQRALQRLKPLSIANASKLDLSRPVPVANQDISNSFVGLMQSQLPGADEDSNYRPKPPQPAVEYQRSLHRLDLFNLIMWCLMIAQLVFLVWGIAWIVSALFKFKRDQNFARSRLGWGCALLALVFLLPIAVNVLLGY